MMRKGNPSFREIVNIVKEKHESVTAKYKRRSVWSILNFCKMQIYRKGNEVWKKL
jgi:hypothetical protein